MPALPPMPQLDLASLGLITLVNLVAMSLILPVAMGRQISPAARQVQHHFLLQGAAWGGLVLVSLHRGSPWEPPLAMAATVAVALAHWALSQALTQWLGPRPGRHWLLLCCIAGPLGFALLWSSPLHRFTWFSLVQGTGLLLLARMCLRPRAECERGWRAVLCGCASAMALVLWLRAAYGWLGGQPLLYSSTTPINHAFAVAGNICNTLSLVAVLVAWRDETNQQLRTLVVTDALTGLLNRRGFDERGAAMLDHARRHSVPLTALMLDLDHFKQVNDRHGHEAGDRALRLFARLLREGRPDDLVGRLGGEEFCVLLLHGSQGAALPLDQRLRERLHRSAVDELGFALDYSAGMATLAPGDAHLAALLVRADTALYAAKAAGRGHLRSG